MLSFDTNIAVYAANTLAKQHSSAAGFLQSLAARTDIVVAEMMLLELYLKLRNPAIFVAPASGPKAVAWCNQFRANPNWQVVDSAPVMEDVWRIAARGDFAFRRIVDARLALTLRYYGVNDFATTNVKDFRDFGFRHVWNPLQTRGAERGS
jgi:uncharacterized protein